MTEPEINVNGQAPDELEDDEFDLACSSCNADLSDDDLFLTFRVCRNCRRHFWLPARERLGLLVDEGTFQETSAELVSIDPLLFHDRLPVADRLAEAREQPTVAEAVITGTAKIGGNSVVVIALDLAVFGSGIGIVAGEKIALAMDQAVIRRNPVIALCSGGSGKGQEGVLALAQVNKLAAAASRLHRVGVPLVSILTHPTSGNVLLGLADQADIAFAEPGAHIGLSSGKETIEQSGMTAETLIERGAIDGIIDRSQIRDTLGGILQMLAERGRQHSTGALLISDSSAAPAREELVYALRPNRSTAREYIARLSTGMVELRGDRAGADHPGIVGGIGRIDGVSAVIVGVQRNESPLNAAAFSKFIRMIRLAAHLELPMISLVETGNAGIVVDDPFSALKMAQSLSLIASMPVPVVSVGIGAIGGLPGMVLMAGDRVLMQEHSVITNQPDEAVASARDCLRLGLIDLIVPEPLPADEDVESAVAQLKIAIGNALSELSGFGPRRLIDDRSRRFRHLGLSTAEGREAARIEWREFQDVQRAFSRSIGDIRERWMQRPARAGRTSLPQFPVRPSMPAITVPKLNFRKPDFTELTSRMAATRRGLAGKLQADEEPEGALPGDKD